MEQAGATADETWMIGDSMVDGETARNAGVRMCVVLYGFGQARGELVLDGSEAVAITASDIVKLVNENKP
jgi:phosphoglycolate phosphatase-like HAD superfamily hydrolase